MSSARSNTSGAIEGRPRSAQERLEGGAHALNGRIDQAADAAQGMISRHELLGRGQHDEPLLLLLVPPHHLLSIRDLQGLLYQGRAEKGREGEPKHTRRTAGPATISAAC